MKLRITVEGKVYEVDVEVVDEQPVGTPKVTPVAQQAPAPAPAAAPPARSSAPAPVVAHDASRCVSPLPGTVLSVHVKPGDEVKTNQTLVVLDAMKMETNVPSPVDGRVKSVAVNNGASVKQGDVLVEFE